MLVAPGQAAAAALPAAAKAAYRTWYDPAERVA
jgi:hypothetical protein